jgi:hypothetical protein
MTATARITQTAIRVLDTDWLGSQPVFYNEKTAQVSHTINDVIDFANLEFDPEGFNNYVRFGYSVFQQTPVRHVRFLPPATRLSIYPNGRLVRTPLDDPVDRWLGRVSDEREALAILENVVREWENEADGEIIVPTSGGYDSRLLNWLVRDKPRIRTFTFGLSARQEQSHEVVYARAVAKRLGIHWQQVPLGDFHRHLDEWDTLFGLSTHAHGMYQLEFYHRVAEYCPPPRPLLSGIIGDAWAGAVEVSPIHTPADLLDLAWTHGMHADEHMSLLHDTGQLAAEYFERHRGRLRDDRFRVVESMRFKIILLTYLLRVPAHVGFQPWSPFLRPDVALALLTLPAERRRLRRWQQELFARHGLDVESRPLRVDRRNSLNQQAIRRLPPPPLDEGLLREVIRPDYVRWINATLRQHGPGWNLLWKLLMRRPWGRHLRRRGLRDHRMQAYCAYLTLRPIENALRRRDQERAQ